MEEKRDIVRDNDRLIPRPDGRGALRAGGKKGNRGGNGRPRNELLHLLRASFEDGLRRAGEMLARRDLDPTELARLLDVVGKYATAYIPPDASGGEVRVVVVRIDGEGGDAP